MSSPAPKHLYVPYPELVAQRDDEVLSLQTPWIAIKGNIDPSVLEFVDFCIKHLHDRRYASQISEFLAPFTDYPIAFVCSHGLSHLANGLTHDDVRAFSHIESVDGHDALAALTFLRRKRLLSECRPRDLREENTAIEQLTEDFARLAVMQNYYITSSCAEILKKSIRMFPKKSAFLIEFESEERGHDAMIASVVKKISASSTPILKETKDFVEILNQSIDAGILAFALGLEIFEGIEFTSKDSPLANIVRKHFGDAAASPLQKHYHLNRQHKHGQVGVTLLEGLEPLNSAEITAAEESLQRFSEAQTKLRTAVFGFATFMIKNRH